VLWRTCTINSSKKLSSGIGFSCPEFLSPWKKRNGTALCAGGRERPQETFGRLGRKKVGSLPPVSVFFPTVTFPSTASCISSVSDKVLAPQGDEAGEEEGGGRNPYLLHPSFSASRSGAPTRRSNSVPKCAVTAWLTPPNSWRMSSWVTRPAFHLRYRCSNRSPTNRVLA